MLVIPGVWKGHSFDAPKNYQHLISPYNITWESHIMVMRIKEMITG